MFDLRQSLQHQAEEVAAHAEPPLSLEMDLLLVSLFTVNFFFHLYFLFLILSQVSTKTRFRKVLWHRLLADPPRPAPPQEGPRDSVVGERAVYDGPKPGLDEQSPHRLHQHPDQRGPNR